MVESDEPLVIKIVNAIGKGSKLVFNFLSLVVYFPLFIMFSISTIFLKPNITNFFIFWISTPFRWIFGTMGFPLLILFPCSLSYLIFRFSLRDGTTVAIISSISTLTILIVLILRGHQRNEPKKRVNTEFLFEKMFLVQLEFISFFFTVISIPLFTRVPLFMNLLRKLRKPEDFYHLGLKIFLYSIFDYLTFITIILSLFTLVRIHIIYKTIFELFKLFFNGEEFKNDVKYYEDDDQTIEIHLYFIFHFFESILDLIIYLILFPILFTVGIYRIKSFFHSIFKLKLKDRRYFCFIEIIEIFKDLPFIILFILLTLFPWRFYILYLKKKSKDSFRILIFIQFCRGLFDYILIFCSIIIFITRYRWNYFLKQISKKESFIWKDHFYSISNLFFILRDIICHTLFLFPILISIYRLRSLYLKWKLLNFHKKSDLIFNQFIQVLIDIPFLILFLLSLWRMILILKFVFKIDFEPIVNVNENDEEEEEVNHQLVTLMNQNDLLYYRKIRNEIIHQFLLTLFDLPTLLFLFILFISIYRMWNLIKYLKKEKDFKNYNHIIFVEFLNLLFDIPYFILSFLSFWRIILILKYLLKKDEIKENELKNEIKHQFTLFLMDIPSILILIILLISFYRIINLINRLKETFIHQVIFNEFIEFLNDLPYIFISILSFYRIIIILFKIFKNNDNNSAIERRRIASHEFKLFLLDIPSIFVIFILLLSFYRIINLINQLKISFEHETIFNEFIDFLKDLPYIFIGVLCLWRIPVILYKIIKNQNDSTIQEKRMISLNQLYFTLLDIPAILFSIILTLSIYRLFSLVSQSKKGREGTTYHFIIFQEFLEFLIDIPFIFIGVLTLYRLPILIYNILFKLNNSNERREKSFIEFKELITDLLFFILFISLFISIIYIPSFFIEFKKFKNRKNNFFNFKIQVLNIIIFSIPFNIHLIILTYLNLFFFWRIFSLFNLIFKEKDKKKIGKGIIVSFLLGIFDIISIPIIIFLLLSFLKTKDIINLLKSQKFILDTNDYFNSFHFHQSILLLLIDFIKDISKKGLLLKLINFILNIPFFFLFLFSFWRIKLILIELKDETLTLNQKRMIILNHFIQMFIDLPFIIFGIILLLSIYRIKYLIKLIIKENHILLKKRNSTIRKVIFYEIYQLMKDIFPILGGILSILFTPWKLFAFFKILFFEMNNNKRREDLIEIFTFTIIDFITSILFLFLFLTIWRIPLVIFKILKEEKNQFRKIIFNEFKESLNDLIIIFNILFIFYTINRIPKFLKRLFNYSKRLYNSSNKLNEMKNQLKYYFSCKKKEKNQDLEFNGIEIENIEIPEEIFHEIFLNLRGEEISKNIELVCKNWKNISSNDNLWLQILEQTKSESEKSNQRNSKFMSILRKEFGTSQNKLTFINNYLNKKNIIKKKKSLEEIDFENGIKYLISDEFKVSISKLYQFLFLPLKLFGLITLPIFIFNYIKRKFKKDENDSKDIIILYEEAKLDFYNFHYHYFLFKSLLIFIYYLFWDLFNITVSFFYFLINVLFLFYPIWKSKLKKNSILFTLFNIYIILIQIISFIPITLFQLFLFILPFIYPIRIIIFNLILNVWIHLLFIWGTLMNSSIMIYLLSFLSFNHILLLPYKLVFISYIFLLDHLFLILYFIFNFRNQLILKLLFDNLWIIYFSFGYNHYLFKKLHQTIPEYKPIYYIREIFVLTYKKIQSLFHYIFKLFKELIIQIVMIYGNILKYSTKLCKKIGFIGEILLIVIAFIWIALPFSIPLILKKYSLFIPTIGISFVLVFKGTTIIRQSWNE
eukprot:gene12001-5401_t